MLTLALGLAFAVVCSLLLSAAELAVFSPSDARVRTLADQGFRGGPAFAALRARPERVLVLLRMGDALADVSAGVLAALLAQAVWGLPGVAAAIGVVAFAILYFGELVPIGLAMRYGVRMGLAVAPTLHVMTRFLALPLDVIARVSGVRAAGADGGALTVTESEIRQLTALGETEGVIAQHERELIDRAFRLDQTQVWDVMTPRVDIFAWQDGLKLNDIASELGTLRFSRVPVYGESIDDITGVLYVRDAFKALLAGQRDVPLRKLAREPLNVPGSLAMTRLLRDFQTRRIHMAIVVDEYGGTDGLVTLEDVIEELVGEIVDETDLAEEPILRVSRTEILADGDADLREINHHFNTTFPLLEHRSLNGYLLEEFGRVPAPGEAIERDGVRLEVVDATETQVTKVRLRRPAAALDGVPERRPGRAPEAARDALRGADAGGP